MSYVDKLFNSFNTVQRNAANSKRCLEDLLRFFRLRVEVEEEHMRGLEKLGRFTMSFPDGTVLNAVNALKNDCYSRAFHSKSLIDSLTSDVISSINAAIRLQAENIKPYTQEAQKIQRAKENQIALIEKSKKKYWRSCQECEKITKALEDVLPQSSREKLLSRLVKEKKDLDENLLSYQDALDEWNRLKESVKDLMTPVLNSFELQEKERLELMKDSMRKLVVYDMSCIRNAQYDLDTLAHHMESMNPLADMKYIIDESEVEPELPEFDFEFYGGELDTFRSFSSSLSSVHTAIQENIQNLPILGSIEDMYYNEIELIISKVINSKDLGSEDFQSFNTLIKDSIGRKVFINILSTQLKDLSSHSFIALSELIISVLNECERLSDDQTCKECLRLSNYFCDPNNNYLASSIKGHSVWRRLDIWEGIISKSINQEISNRDVYKVFENVSEQKSVIKNIVFCVLGGIAVDMNTFGVEKVYGSEVLSKQACRFDLSGEDIDTLMATFDPRLIKGIEEAPGTVQRGVPEWLKAISSPPLKKAQLKLSSIFNKPNK